MNQAPTEETTNLKGGFDESNPCRRADKFNSVGLINQIPTIFS